MSMGLGRIGAIDVGATTIKFACVDEAGNIVGPLERYPTAYPCWPESLLNQICLWIDQHELDFVAIGFPGDMENGIVLEPGNLSRIAGITSAIHPAIDSRWRDFPIEQVLQQRCSMPVRVVNDALLAAYGLSTGSGRELVFTLGTGLGIALFVDGQPVRIRDIGAESFEGAGSYDEVFGERGRQQNEDQWRRNFQRAVRRFVEEFSATEVHLGGGNARLWTLDEWSQLHIPVALHGNEGAMRAAARLYASSTTPIQRRDEHLASAEPLERS
jgi:hypothetical protein